MNKQEYNGWTNYETWAVALWLGNDEGSYSYWKDQAVASLAVAPQSDNVPKVWTVAEAAKFTLADQLKAEVEEAAPDLGASMFADLLNAALSEVNWDEIAENMLEGVAEAQS